MSSNLKILQNNLHKSMERTHSILNDEDTKQYSVLMLQEQHWSTFTKSSPTHTSWTLIEPAVLDNLQPRAVIYTNNKLIPPSQVTPITLPFRDAAAVALDTKNTKPSLLINVYNPCDKGILSDLHIHLETNINKQDYDLIVLAGDFNSHHPLWNPSGYLRHDAEGDALIDLAAMLGLSPLLPPGTITYPSAGTAIDLVWGNSEATSRMMSCKVADKHDHASDHLPIETTLALPMDIPQPSPPYNYAKTNWQELDRKLVEYLPNPSSLKQEEITAHDVDRFADELTTAISKAVKETTPRKRPCPHSKRWWTAELTALRREANRLRNTYRRTKLNIDKVAWRKKANHYMRKIAQAKKDKWREFVKGASQQSIWQVKRYVTNIPVPSFVPTLDGHAASHGQKVELLQKGFFPQPPPAVLEDISKSAYPQEVPFAPEITIWQVREAVARLAPDKAPGPDEITNRVLKNSLSSIEDHIQALMQASLRLGHFPKCFKHTITAVLRKPGKPDYTKAKAYRPIALESALGKVMESIMADLMSYLTEMYQLLPAQHYGGRPGRSVEDAMMALSESIHSAWKEKLVYTAIFLDVAGAFNNVHHKRLKHNLLKRCMPKPIVQWITSFLEGRSTQLHFNATKSERILTPAGVPQGSPLSPLLYMYYNADLLDIPRNRGISLGFIDDVVFGVQGRSDIGNICKLRAILREAEEWRIRHGVQFEPTKYVLVHYTRNRRQATDAAITVGDITIKPFSEVKYLGVIFDQELRFKSQLQYVVKKGTNAALALASITKNGWGVQYKYARQLFNAVIAPRMDYGAIVWHRPKQDGSTASTAQVQKLTTVQRLAMKAITGCYRTTPTAAMEIEAELQPLWIRLQTKVLLAITRMRSLSATHPIQEWISNALRTRTAKVRHRSVLENALQQFPILTENIETIEPFIRPPWWVPKVKVQVSAGKDEAKKLHDSLCNKPGTEDIYTDGSGIEGKIGAAAYQAEINQASLLHLGRADQYNVFAAELAAMCLSATTVQESNEHLVWNVFTDSQAAIQAVNRPHRQSGQSIIKEFLDTIDEAVLENPELQVALTWVPGHSEIEGNEMADAEAKKAAINPMAARPFHHRPLRSARVQSIKAAAKAQWLKEWHNGTRTSHALRRIMKRPGVKSGTKLYGKISNREAVAALTRLRTGHCRLKHYLHRFKLADTPYCECRHGKETVEHYLLECKLYVEQRKELRKKVGVGRMRVEKLLGYPRLVKHTVEFVASTKGLDI